MRGSGPNPFIMEPGKFYSFILSAREKNGIAYILENNCQGKGKMLETEAMTTSSLDSSAVMAYPAALG